MPTAEEIMAIGKRVEHSHFLAEEMRKEET
jgi:hypothetical protein